MSQAQAAVLWPWVVRLAWPCRGLYRDTMPCLKPPSGHDTIFISRPSLCLLLYRSPHSSVTIQHLVLRHNPPACHFTLLSRYKRLYRDTPQQINHRLSRYNRLYRDMLPSQLHTQKAMSRYNFPLYRDIVWAIAQPVLHLFFYFFTQFFFSSSFLLLEKHQKKYIAIFFLIVQYTQINL